MSDERNPRDFAASGGRAKNAKLSSEQRTKIAEKLNRAKWRGHKKGKKNCACKACVSRRAKKRIKK